MFQRPTPVQSGAAIVASALEARIKDVRWTETSLNATIAAKSSASDEIARSMRNATNDPESEIAFSAKEPEPTKPPPPAPVKEERAPPLSDPIPSVAPIPKPKPLEAPKLKVSGPPISLPPEPANADPKPAPAPAPTPRAMTRLQPIPETEPPPSAPKLAAIPKVVLTPAPPPQMQPVPANALTPSPKPVLTPVPPPPATRTPPPPAPSSPEPIRPAIVAQPSTAPLIRPQPVLPSTTGHPSGSSAQTGSGTAAASSSPGAATSGSTGIFRNQPSTSAPPASTNPGAEIALFHAQVKNAYVSRWKQPKVRNTLFQKLRVKTEIAIAPDGRVLSARIIQPSGNAHLDQSVAQALASVPNVQPLPASFQNSPYQVVLNFDL